VCEFVYVCMYVCNVAGGNVEAGLLKLINKCELVVMRVCMYVNLCKCMCMCVCLCVCAGMLRRGDSS
jgi:hypothetical protein